MLNLVNALALAVYLPLLFATAMSFDAPGSGGHWTHWFFVISAVLLGPLGLIGRIAQQYRWAGPFGAATFALSILLLEAICNGTFTCR